MVSRLLKQKQKQQQQQKFISVSSLKSIIVLLSYDHQIYQKRQQKSIYVLVVVVRSIGQHLSKSLLHITRQQQQHKYKSKNSFKRPTKSEVIKIIKNNFFQDRIIIINTHIGLSRRASKTRRNSHARVLQIYISPLLHPKKIGYFLIKVIKISLIKMTAYDRAFLFF